MSDCGTGNPPAGWESEGQLRILYFDLLISQFEIPNSKLPLFAHALSPMLYANLARSTFITKRVEIIKNIKSKK
jgi:hypothetical protein